MAHGDIQPGLGRQSGQLDLPRPEPVAVRSPGVGGDQQPVGLGEAVTAHLVPPPADGLDGELGGIGRVADVDPSLVVGHVVDPVGDGLGVLAQARSAKSWTFTRTGCPSGCPLGAAVGVVADQLLLLGVDADHRLAVVDEGCRPCRSGSGTGRHGRDAGVPRSPWRWPAASSPDGATGAAPNGPTPRSPGHQLLGQLRSTTSTSSATSTSGCPGSRGCTSSSRASSSPGCVLGQRLVTAPGARSAVRWARCPPPPRPRP